MKHISLAARYGRPGQDSPAFMQSNGDMGKTLDAAAKAGVQPKTLFALKSSMLDQQTKMATLSKDQLANTKQQADLVGQHTQAILALPTEQRRAALQQSVTQMAQQGLMQPQEAQQTLTARSAD